MFDKLLKYCNNCISGFNTINNDLIALDDLFKKNGKLNKIQLDELDNCNWFINKAFAYLMPYGYKISGSNPLDKCHSVLKALLTIKRELNTGRLNNNCDYDFILWSLYMQFYNYGEFVGAKIE